MRKLQIVYKLEPAGSHGVWSLDDYQFLPFYFGSSQLKNHPFISPKAIASEESSELYGEQYMFFGCIKYIREVKTGPFWEHSSVIYSLTSVNPNTWEKINLGMMKMYKGEVLAKFPVMQHFFFGSILPWTHPEQ